MVSPIPYRSNKDLPKLSGYRAVTITVVIFIALIAFPQVSFFIVGLVYVTSGPLEMLYRYRTGKSLELASVLEAGAEEAVETPADEASVTPLREAGGDNTLGRPS